MAPAVRPPSAVVLANARTHTAETIRGYRGVDEDHRNDEGLWLWVLAFARTTSGRLAVHWPYPSAAIASAVVTTRANSPLRLASVMA